MIAALGGAAVVLVSLAKGVLLPGRGDGLMDAGALQWKDYCFYAIARSYLGIPQANWVWAPGGRLPVFVWAVTPGWTGF